MDIKYFNNMNQKDYAPNTLKGLFNGDISDMKNLNLQKHQINLMNENISGIIKRKNEEYNKNLKTSENNKVQLKRTERLHFIEYGSTIGYVRPHIRKGIDYEHIPKVEFEKYDSNSPITVLNRPFVVNDKIIGSSKFA